MAEVVAAAERLLDLQILDADGRQVGKVDDLEFTVPEDGGSPFLCAVLCGPLAFGPRLGGRLGLRWERIAVRLRPEPDPQPVRLDFGLVTVEAADLRVAAPDLESVGAGRLEVWLRDHFISRIPGAR